MKTPPMNRSRTASETLSAISPSHFPPHPHRTTMSKTPSQPAPFRAATTALLLILALLAGVSSAHAQANGSPPERMTFQGFLVDGNGVTLATNAPKNYDVVFRIWDAPTTGNKLWTEQQTVTVDKGYFSILLGEGGTVGAETRNALSTLFNTNTASERHVEMTVKGIGAAGTDVTLLPRLRLLSSPYAFLAQQSVSAGRAAKLVNGAGVDLVTSVGTGITVAGPITATSVIGNGANLTSLNASQITSGMLDNARTTASSLNVANAIVMRDNTGDVTVQNLNANSLMIAGRALIDVVYPVGIFYTQYPDVDSNDETTAFPINRRPGGLFPGTTWVEQYTDGGFFRTKGGNSGESRVNGVQDYALKRLTGYTTYVQADYWRRAVGQDGVFANSVDYLTGGTDSGSSSDGVVRSYFDSAIQALPSTTEVRPKNRLMKIWKRTQ